MRPRLSALKPLFVAAGLLIASACGTELFLRVREPVQTRGYQASAVSPDGSLTEPSRTLHHQLRPLTSFESRDPDTGEAIAIAVNSHGLRGAETTVPKPPGVFRVLCLGGETVFGPELAEAHTLPARLQELLQPRTRLRVEVLNGGLPGDCPLLAWLRLRNSLLGLQPDLILFDFDMSDVADDQRHRRQTRIDAAGVPVACEHPELVSTPGARPWWRDLRLTDSAAALAGGLTSRGDASAEIHDPRAATMWLRDNPPDWELYVEQALAPVEALGRAAEGSYAAFILSVCPQPWQVSADASDGPGVREAAGVANGAVLASRAPFEAVAAFARRHHVVCCDASMAFREYAEPAKLYFRNSSQLSRYGQELYARHLSEFIAARHPAFGAAEGDEPGSAEEASAETAEVTHDEARPPEPTAMRPWEPVQYR